MKPRLLRADATTFNNLGFGALTHTISCKVTEELGVAPTLEMSVLMDDPNYVNIEVGNIITAIPNKSTPLQAFVIEEISKPIDGVVTIYATHIAQHRGKLIPVQPFTASDLDDALTKIKNNSMEANPFTLVRDSGKTNVVATMKQTVPHSFRELMGGVEGSILDTYRGEWGYDNFVCTLYNKRGRDNGARVMYGRNMSDFNLEEQFNWDNSVTGVFGYWTNSEDGTTVLSDIQYSEYADRYPYKKTVCVDFSDKFETAPSTADLNTYALSWINGKGLIGASVDVAYEHVNVDGGADVGLGDIVHIYNGVYDFEMESRIVGLEFDVLSEEYTNVSIGDMKTTLNEAISDIGGGSSSSSSGGSSVEPSTTTPLMDGVAAIGTEQKYARGDHVHPTDINLAKSIGIPKKVNTWVRNFTMTQWETLGAVGHEEVWAATGYDNSHIYIGDMAYLEGTATDLGGKAVKVYGIITGKDANSVSLKTERLEVEGRTFGAYPNSSRRLVNQATITSGTPYTYTAPENVIAYIYLAIQANSSATVQIQINGVSLVDNATGEAVSFMFNIVPVMLQKGDVLKVTVSTNRPSSITIFALK